MRLQAGTAGQFDVVVDGEVVATRSGGLLKKVLGGGWPEPEAVVAAIEQKRGPKPA